MVTPGVSGTPAVVLIPSASSTRAAKLLAPVPPKVLAAGDVRLRALSPGVWSLDLDKGQAAVLYAGATRPDLAVAPLAMDKGDRNRFGLRTTLREGPRKRKGKKSS